MKPMGSTSTPFIKYAQIKVEDVDIYEDAFGLYFDLGDELKSLRQLNVVPGKALTRRLIERVRKQQ
jgi:hypothetical protein